MTPNKYMKQEREKNLLYTPFQEIIAVQIHNSHRKFAAQMIIFRRKTCCPNLGRDLSPLLKHTELILGRGYKTHREPVASVVVALRA